MPVLLLVSVGAVRAQTPPQPLTLPEFLARVQATYPKLAAADAERRTAPAKLLEKQGAFDPVLVGDHTFTRFNDTGSPGKVKSFTATDASVEFLTPSGAKIVAGAQLNRGDVKSPLSVTGVDGEYFLGIKLPLLRGLGINPKSAALQQARLGIALADSTYQSLRLEVLVAAGSAYWDWVAVVQRVDVAAALLELARVRAQAVRDRAQAGDLPLIDVVEAEQEVQRRIEGLEKARRDLQKETNKLSLYLWDEGGVAAPPPPPGAAPPAVEPGGVLEELEVTRLQAQALQQRPELRILAAAGEVTRVDLRLARNLRLPDLNLSVQPGFDTGAEGAGPTLKAGISLGLPLRQRTARGLEGQAERKLEKIALDLQFERQRVQVQVQDAANAVNQAYRRYVAAREELRLAQRLEQGERDRFNLGDSTLFLVNQRERSTAEAANRVISIRAEYEQALVLFRAVTVQL